jgi:hypothetical protein
MQMRSEHISFVIMPERTWIRNARPIRLVRITGASRILRWTRARKQYFDRLRDGISQQRAQ